jgi:hypothetical protein
MDSKMGVTALSARTLVALLCEGGAVAIKAAQVSINGRPFSATTVGPIQ